MSSVSNLQLQYSATIVLNTITHDNYTFPKLRITPRTYFFMVEEDVVQKLGLRQYLDIGEETPRSTRLYVDGHL